MLRARWVVVALLVGSAAPVFATITQITDLPVNRTVSVPSIGADAHYVAFSSNGNVGGLNSTPQTNVFTYEVPTGIFARITTQGGSDPSISADNRWLTFTSSANYIVRNVDGSDEIFRYDRIGRHYLQITMDNLGDGSSAHPNISGNGTRIAFETSSNLLRRNLDFSNEVYFFKQVANVGISYDPNGDGSSANPVISADGRYIAFETTSNQSGLNDDFSSELMVYDATTRLLLQYTYDPGALGDSTSPAINKDGTYIAFVSGSNLARLNPDNDDAVWVLNRPRHSFALITQTVDGPFSGATPSISDDARWVAFTSTANPAGQNVDRNREVFLFDQSRKTYTQLTNTIACLNSNPKLSGDGTHIVFKSTCDITGGNADHGQELFIAENPNLKLVVEASGPVTLEVRDPNDLLVRNDVNLVPGATYEQGDFDNDGIPDARVSIPKAGDGIYRMVAFPNLGALATDSLSMKVTLNAITVWLANATLGELVGTDFSFNLQGLARPSGNIRPKNGLGSRLILIGSLTESPGNVGAVTARVTDGTHEVFFDLGRVENYVHTATRKTFKVSQNGFIVTVRTVDLASGMTVISLAAVNGNLSMFAGSENANITVALQVGPDAYFYQRRFVRRVTGDLYLQ